MGSEKCNNNNNLTILMNFKVIFLTLLTDIYSFLFWPTWTFQNQAYILQKTRL